MKVPALLKNKFVCYALMALAALNVIGYVTVKSWECLALFALAGYSAHCYCKNVSLAILAALFVANFVFGCGRVKEGMEDMMKGPAEHMADAVEASSNATSQCNAAALAGSADAAAARTACEAAKDAAQNACKYTDPTGTFSATNMGTCEDPAPPTPGGQ